MEAAGPLDLGVWLDELRLGVREALDRVRTWPVGVVGLDAFGPEVNPRSLSTTGCRHLAHYLQSSGLTPVALRADVGKRRLADAVHLDVNLQRIGEAFELARVLRVPRVVVPLGRIPVPQETVEPATHRALAEAVKAIAALATRTGICPVAATGNEAPPRLAEFLQNESPGELFEVELNPAALICRGCDPLAALSTLSSRVGLATGMDAYHSGGEAPFGKGDVQWGALIVGLATLGRRVPLLAGCTLEGDRPAAVLAAVRRLNELLRNPMA